MSFTASETLKQCFDQLDAGLGDLSKFFDYWWAAQAQSQEYQVIQSDGGQTVTILQDANDTTSTESISYSDTVSASSTGIALNSPSAVSVSYDTYQAAEVLQGKYIKSINGESTYFVPATAQITRDCIAGTPYYAYYVRITPCYYVYSARPGDKSFVHSNDRSAHPDNGVVDNVTYTFLGSPLARFARMPIIETVSYTGTGAYGSASSSTVTFSGRVLFLWLCDQYGNVKYSGPADVLTATLTKSVLSGSTSVYMSLSDDGKTLTWYGSSTSTQLNVAAATYRVSALVVGVE